MARKKKPQREETPALWLVTFTDLMFLMLTFFVLLVSMSVIDERAKMVVIGSVTRVFGSGQDIFNPLSQTQPQTSSRIEPGVMEADESDELAQLRDMLFDDVNKDLNFQENKYVQIFSIHDEVLFEPGRYVLREAGVAQLDRILPYLQRIDYPLLIAGHTSVLREEVGSRVIVHDQLGMDSTWVISFRRSLAVYRHLVSRGIEPSRLSLESFGQFRPRFSNNTPDGRRRNRRVDLVLDRRNQEWIRKVEELREEAPIERDGHFRGFRFNLTVPGLPVRP
jgi:chemotaxis protein MotB